MSERRGGRTNRSAGAGRDGSRLRDEARRAVDVLRDAAREGRVIEFRQRDPLVMAIHRAIDAVPDRAVPDPLASDTGQGLTGVFDNPGTMARERWVDGKVVEFLTANVLLQKHVLPDTLTAAARKDWGSYPAPPSAPLASSSMSRVQLWSCGGGTQSAALAALIIQGRVERPDVAVMVDTEREKSQTWRYVQTVLQPALAAFGVPLEIVRKSEFATVDIYALNGDLLLPVFTSDGGRLGGFCSNEWKRRVVMRWCHSKGFTDVQNWIGYSLDEAKRVKTASERWFQPRYPLIDLRLRRADCVNLVEAMGWPTPPRSACWMCPHMTYAEWRQMKQVDPADFDRAVVLDELIREEDSNVFVHRSGTPLRTADLGAEDAQGRLFGCDSGQCFV